MKEIVDLGILIDDESAYQQIGNAVPPVLGRAVAEVVLELLGVEKKDFIPLRSIYKNCKK